MIRLFSILFISSNFLTTVSPLYAQQSVQTPVTVTKVSERIYLFEGGR